MGLIWDVNVFTAGFQLSSLFFLVKPPTLRIAGRFGGFTFGASDGGTFEQLLQPIEGILSVFSWVRWVWALMTITPSLVIRRSRIFSKRDLWIGDMEEALMSNRS